MRKPPLRQILADRAIIALVVGVDSVGDGVEFVASR